MDVLKRFANAKRRMQSLRNDLSICEKEIKVIETKLKNTTSFGDIIVGNAKHITYSERVNTYYKWLKTHCLNGVPKDKSDAKWAWFDFQRENDATYYLENEDTMYQKVIDTWEKSNANAMISFKSMMRCRLSKYISNNHYYYSYPHPTFLDYNEPRLWSHEVIASETITDSTQLFTLNQYKQELKRCEDELCKVKQLFDDEFEKLNKHDYKGELCCLLDKKDTLQKTLQDTENYLESIIAEIDSMTDDYDELDTHSDISSVSGFQ
jgi:hypothetical protein